MTTPDPDQHPTPGPDQHPTPGERGGSGVPPGETPPAEDGLSGISHPEPPELRKAWGPVPLVLIMLLSALILVGLIAMAVDVLS